MLEAPAVIPFTHEISGLRDYRASCVQDLAPARWPWILALVVVAFLAGLALGVSR